MSALERLFCVIGPARDILLCTLAPSDILSLCVAIGCSLTAVEKRKKIHPLRELFHKPEWLIDKMRQGTDVLLIGDDITKLCDYRYRDLNVYLFTYAKVDSETRHMYDVDGLSSDVQRNIDSITSIHNIRPEVCHVDTYDKHYRICICTRRITLYTSVMIPQRIEHRIIIDPIVDVLRPSGGSNLLFKVQHDLRMGATVRNSVRVKYAYMKPHNDGIQYGTLSLMTHGRPAVVEPSVYRSLSGIVALSIEYDTMDGGILIRRIPKQIWYATDNTGLVSVYTQ